MTYCVALRLDSGMIFASDSRTNAGVDHVATFCKMKVYEKVDERLIVVLSSGNLAITQGVNNILDRQLKLDEDGTPNLMNVTSMYDAAALVGDALREMQRRDGPWLMQSQIDANASMLVGGQIKGEEQRLFHVYSQGNFIESMEDTPFFQLGESKYGKPILDRVSNRATPLAEAAKCALISMDSTIRSNLSVGLPLDLLCIRRDEIKVLKHINIDARNEYFNMIRSQWGERLRQVFSELPDAEWLAD